MTYCTRCGNRINDGERFCTNCGNPVTNPMTATGTPGPGNNMAGPVPPYVRPVPKKFNIGNTDYRRLNNVYLVSTPSQHVTFHILNHVMGGVVLIYLLIEFFPLILPLLLEVEGASEIEYVPDSIPGVWIMFFILVISGLIQRKIRYDIIHRLPKGFDRWKIMTVLKWQVFGFESLKVAVLRLLQRSDCNYPELGFGTDDEGNYYAFTVSGQDVDRYPAWIP